MPKVTHTIYTNKGMNNKDGCYFCSNMRKDPKGGMMADYKLSIWDVKTASTKTEWMSYMVNFVQREYNNDISIFSKDSVYGDIYVRDELGTSIFRAMDYSQTASTSRGLAVESYGRLSCHGSQAELPQEESPSKYLSVSTWKAYPDWSAGRMSHPRASTSNAIAI